MVEKKTEDKPVKDTKAEEKSPKRIYRSKTDRIISGVCGGFAEYFAIDPTIVRVIWAVSVFFGGVGLMAYVLGWIIIPENSTQTQDVSRSERKPQNTNLIWGLVLIILGALFLFRQLDWLDFYPFYHWHMSPRWFWNFRFDLWLPVAIILIGAIYLINVLKKDKSPEKLRNSETTGGKTMEKKLTRSAKDRMIAGVCGGLAVYFNIDPSLVRIGFALLTLAGGGVIGIVAYIVMMVVIPEESVAEAGTSATAATKAPKTEAPPVTKATPRKPKTKK